MKVFNYQLDMEVLENEYYLSKFEISLQWNQGEMTAIKKLLSEYVLVEGIIEWIVNYCCFRNHQNSV